MLANGGKTLSLDQRKRLEDEIMEEFFNLTFGGSNQPGMHPSNRDFSEANIFNQAQERWQKDGKEFEKQIMSQIERKRHLESLGI